MNLSRRTFFGGALAMAASAPAATAPKAPKIQGFNEQPNVKTSGAWQPYSDKKVRVGIAGYGACKFGAMFSYQEHPNVEVVAATDLFPDRCAQLAKAVGAKRTYASCEEMIDKEKELDAVYIATDAPSHVHLCIRALNRGLHVCSAVPAILGREQLEFIPALIEAVKKSGKVYQLNETTAFRPQCFAMRNLYNAGAFGALVYTEGEYWHYSRGGKGVGSYNGWRKGLPPQYYPTHSNGYYTCTTHKAFTEVTCIAKPSKAARYNGGDNRYGNPYGTEVALLKTEEGGSARMLVCWDIPSAGGEIGRCWGEKGFYQNDRYVGDNSLSKGVATVLPGLPPGVKNVGHHGGSHPYLTDDFIRAILLKQRPCVDLKTALDTTVAGIYAHLSAMKGGETMKVPQFELV